MTKYIDILLLQTVMYAGFAVSVCSSINPACSNTNEIGSMSTRTSCAKRHKSIHEGQKSQFDTVKVGKSQIALVHYLTISQALYLSGITTDEHVLSQVSILLSLWAPCDAETHINSFWVSRASHHAREDQQHNSDHHITAKTRRRKLIWWWCLIRGWMIALGFRHPERLQNLGCNLSLLTEEDFGLEAKFPTYMSIKAKKVLMLAFSEPCQLSDIMENIVVF